MCIRDRLSGGSRHARWGLTANCRRGPKEDGCASRPECQANRRASHNIPNGATVYQKRTERCDHHNSARPVVTGRAEDLHQREKVQADDCLLYTSRRWPGRNFSSNHARFSFPRRSRTRSPARTRIASRRAFSAKAQTARRRLRQMMSCGIRAVSYTHLDVYKRQVYAMAVLDCLTGEAESAIQNLQLAIQLRPENRYHARNDEDFSFLQEDPRFTELLYPERESSSSASS